MATDSGTVSFSGVGVALGAGAGVAVGTALHNIPAGFAIGAAAGLAVGLIMTRLKDSSDNPPTGTDSK